MLQYCPADITEKFGKESFGMKKKYMVQFFSLFFYCCYFFRFSFMLFITEIT